jgi:hypothetical protein
MRLFPADRLRFARPARENQCRSVDRGLDHDDPVGAEAVSDHAEAGCEKGRAPGHDHGAGVAEHAGRAAAWADGCKVLVAKFKGTAALKRKINPTRVPIEKKESMRWLDNLRCSTELAGFPALCVHIGDRESDIYELFCLAQDLGTNFLVRSCVDRLAEDGQTTIAQVMAEVRSSGTHEVRFRDPRGREHRAVLSVRHATMTVRPPIGKREYRHQQT